MHFLRKVVQGADTSQSVAAEALVGGMGVGKGGQRTRLSPTIAAFCYVSSLDIGERFLSDVTPPGTTVAPVSVK